MSVDSSINAIERLCSGRSLNDQHGARRFLALARHGSGHARSFVEYVGNSCYEPTDMGLSNSDQTRAKEQAVLGIFDAMFGRLGVNTTSNVVQTVRALARRCCQLGQTGLLESAMQVMQFEIAREIQAAIKEEERKRPKASAQSSSGLTGGMVGFPKFSSGIPLKP